LEKGPAAAGDRAAQLAQISAVETEEIESVEDDFAGFVRRAPAAERPLQQAEIGSPIVGRR